MTAETTWRDQATVVAVLAVIVAAIAVLLPVVGFSPRESLVVAALGALWGFWEFVLGDTSF